MPVPFVPQFAGFCLFDFNGLGRVVKSELVKFMNIWGCVIIKVETMDLDVTKGSGFIKKQTNKQPDTRRLTEEGLEES